MDEYYQILKKAKLSMLRKFFQSIGKFKLPDSFYEVRITWVPNPDKYSRRKLNPISLIDRHQKIL